MPNALYLLSQYDRHATSSTTSKVSNRKAPINKMKFSLQSQDSGEPLLMQKSKTSTDASKHQNYNRTEILYYFNLLMHHFTNHNSTQQATHRDMEGEQAHKHVRIQYTHTTHHTHMNKISCDWLTKQQAETPSMLKTCTWQKHVGMFVYLRNQTEWDHSLSHVSCSLC